MDLENESHITEAKLNGKELGINEISTSNLDRLACAGFLFDISIQGQIIQMKAQIGH